MAAISAIRTENGVSGVLPMADVNANHPKWITVSFERIPQSCKKRFDQPSPSL